MKRFTDTEKWQGWFRNLKPVYKCLWFFIHNNCDIAGVWKIDRELAEFQIGVKINWEEAKNLLGDKIYAFNDGRNWLILDFINLQNGNSLNPKSPPHKKIIDLLTHYGIHDKIVDENNRVSYSHLHTLCNRVVDRAVVEDKVEVRVKEEADANKRGIVKGGKENYVKEKYPDMAIVNMTRDEYERLVAQFGEEGTRQRIENLFLYIGSKGEKYKNHYLTILNWERKNHDSGERRNAKSSGGIKADPGKYASVPERILNFDLSEQGMQ